MKKALITLFAATGLNAFAAPPEQAAESVTFFNQTENGFELKFNDKNYRSLETNVNGETIKFRAFEHIVYVKNPIEPEYQSMHIYVPEAYFNQGEINGYNADTAPIFLPNSIGGYMPAKPATFDKKGRGNNANNANTIQVALSKGYVVASVGARGRTLEKDGVYTGKAPAAIIDLKAAVRYLHFNNKYMPGDAKKIISNGTSAGGALSSLLGASGDNTDYAEHLNQLGAANASDTVFAVSAYCPITNLENADSAYEWQFNGLNQYSRMNMSRMNTQIYNDRSKPMPKVEGELTPEQIQLSDQLKKQFPDYLNGLALKDEQGHALTLDAQGNGSFKEYLKAELVKSANTALQSGADFSDKNWVKIENSKVSDIDWHGYIHSEKRMKSPPAFDAVDLSAGENNLFGTEKVNNRHFTDFSMKNSSVKGEMADDATIRLMNPMHYLENSPTQHWRIRAGTSDRDTSLAISAILSISLKMDGKNVDYATPWGVGHGGDYDLDELFEWADSISKSQ